jgi:predicted RecB family nuclease
MILGKGLKITSEVISASLECPRKAFLLLHGISGDQNSLEVVLEERASQNRNAYFTDKGIDISHSPVELKNLTSVEFAANALLCFQDLRASVDLLETECKTWLPIIAIGCATLKDTVKIKLAFAGHLLYLLKVPAPRTGIVITTIGQKVVRLDRLYMKVRETLHTAKSVRNNKHPPKVQLRSGCGSCKFWPTCYSEAVEIGDLSLLSGLGSKKIANLNRKGIFSIEQLALTYRAGRRKKVKGKNGIKANYQPALHAMAIRVGKILIEQMPEFNQSSHELYMDLEGLPEENFYYLAGVLVKEANVYREHTFWADSTAQECDIFMSLVQLLRKYPSTPILHYGRYDANAIKQLSKRYKTNVTDIDDRLINANSYIYGNIYFPVYSNSLKDLGHYLEINWPSNSPTSVQPIMWRYLWEDSGDDEYKEKLIQYNLCDCRALSKLVGEITRIKSSAETNRLVEFANQCGQQRTSEGKKIHDEFRRLLISGHMGFHDKKIGWSKRITKTINGRRSKEKRLRPNFQVRVRRRLTCPKCHSSSIRPSYDKIAEVTLTDLLFVKHGCRKRVIRYYGDKVRCRKCKESYVPKRLHALKSCKYGDGFVAWCIYQRVLCRLPYQIISQIAKDMFGIDSTTETIRSILIRAGARYSQTSSEILKELLKSSAIHIDDTRIPTMKNYAYVWVITDGDVVFFDATPTREAAPVLAKLTGFSGVLVSDFYPGFDKAPFRQQKCWAHLIEDLNDVLWKEPFNRELETFIGGVKTLIVPIIDDFNRFGPKSYHLKKFNRNVASFYKRYVEQKEKYETESVQRFQKRFLRYRESLFTFLEEDKIPWNNNTGERALRHIAVQRKISTAPFSMNGFPQYLTLLSIAQTCRFLNKPFLKFLLSGEKSISTLLKERRG